MTKNRLLFIFILSFLSFSAMPQNKQLTLDNLIPGGKSYSKFVPENLPQLQWMGEQYIYSKKGNLYCGTPGKQERVLFDLAVLNEALNEAGCKTLKSMPRFTVPDKELPVLAFYTRTHLLLFDTGNRKISGKYELNPDWGNYDYCNRNGYVAFTDENKLGIISPEGKVAYINQDNKKDIVFGKSVHQNEFGISKGTFWSPQGNAIAFYRMDESMVTDYPFVNIDKRCATAEPHKYPMAGMKSHHVTVGVYQLQSGKTVWLKTGTPKEKYLTNIAWSPDEKHIYIAELNREQNEMHLVRYNAETGEKEMTLFTETDSRYVEPQHPVLFLPNDPEKFIWQSERDGYNHLYLYNTDGKLLKQLTKGEWVVLDLLGFDKKGENLFLSSTQPHPLSSNLNGSPLSIKTWKLNIKKGTLFCMTNKKPLLGVHTSQVSASGKYIIDNYSTPDTPRNIEIIETKKGESLQTLLQAANPFEGYDMPAIETGTIKAADGETTLYFRLIKPVGFDPNKKYPTIIYVYGGPHAQLVTGDWLNGTRGWDIYMAQRGYIVFTVDGRGSANRGHAFESVIHRNLGVNEMADQMKGVEFLKSQPFVDADRIGVHGWSYGGFMTTNLMLSHPDVFKVGVAGGPVIDWSNYEIMYGERYMDRPQDNPEGYKNANLKLKAGNLKGHLLLIHGDIDPVVVWQHSLGFLKACVDANTYPDYFVYPRHLHNVIGKDRPHLHEKITRYFDDYLK